MSFLKKIAGLFSDNRKQPESDVKSLPVKPVFSVDTLTDNEKQYCNSASLTEEDGLFLKKLTKRPIEKIQF